MSSTSGLSSNTSNNNPRMPMNLDASTRESLKAQSQARVLAGMGVVSKDDYSGGGSLSPLKGLYSAAAAAFLKNKQGRQVEAGEQSKNSFESSATAVKKLAADSSGEAWQNAKANVSGPASSGGYKKYAWQGKPGPTGSDTLENDAPAAPAAPSGDIDQVFNNFTQVINDNGGQVKDNGDGTGLFSVMDITGSFERAGDTITGTVQGSTGDIAFSVDKDGAVQVVAGAAEETSAQFAQVQGLLSGSLDGVRSLSDPEPAAPPPSGGPTPEEQAAADAAKAAEEAAKAAAAKAAADAAAAAAASNGGPYKNSADLMKAFVTEIQKAGGSSVNSNGDHITQTTFRGMTGNVEEKDGEIRGKLNFGLGSVEFRVNLSGELTKFNTSGISLLKAGDFSALKDVLGKLDRTRVNVVA